MRLQLHHQQLPEEGENKETAAIIK